MNCEGTSYEFAKTYCKKNLRNIDVDKIVFLRGYFESSGNISNKTLLHNNLECTLKCDEYILSLINELNFKYEIISNNKDDINLIFENYNAFDFLSKLYDNSDARYRKSEFYNKYIYWNIFFNNNIPICRFFKDDPDAVIPKKERASDVGYDLTIIKKVKDIGAKTALYDTGIIVAPDFGYYTKIVPRSSIIKSGYMLTNSIGIIDGTYRGHLMICLTKIDETMPDLILPFRCCQLILDRSLHYIMEDTETVDKLGYTNRGEGGFGSTNK